MLIYQHSFGSLDFFDDYSGIGRPFEGLRILVMGCDIVGDGANEFDNGMKDAPPNASVGEIAKPSLN